MKTKDTSRGLQIPKFGTSGWHIRWNGRYTDPSGWEACGLSYNNPFHDNWSKSFVEPVYEPRDFGFEQLTDFEAIWMQGNEVHGGDGGGGSNSGDGRGNENSTPDDPPGSKKNTNQQLKERAEDAPLVISTEATIVERAAKLTWTLDSEVAELNKVLNITDKVGIWALGINIFINFERAYTEEISWQSFTMRTLVSGVEYVSFRIPYAGLLVGGGLLYYDYTGGFENTLYNDAWLHNHVSPYVVPIKQYLTPNYSEYGQMPIYYRHGK